MRLILALLTVTILTPGGVRAQAPQQLRTEYPEIRLSDKRVFSHARVESFDGISFCISHESGIEAAVPWELMPSVWKTAFPRDPARKARLAESARANEAKNPQPPPGSLKPSESDAVATNENAAEIARQQAFDRAVLEHKVLIGMTAEQCLQAWGKPYRINRDITPSGVSEQWCYRGENSYLYLVNGVLQSIQN